MSFIFWFSFITLIYIFIGYPLILTVYAAIRKKTFKKEDIEPSVTLIIPAYNEEKVIEEKIKNSLSIDYPKDKLEIIIASDGSTDNTTKIVKKYEESSITLHDHKERRGKPQVLNDAVGKARGEIIVFSDASSIFDKDAVKKLVRNFADERVGCVCGDYKFGYEHETSRSKGEGLYVRYELFIKRKEAQAGTLLGLHGAIYAIRKGLYTPLKPDMINDDYVVSAKIVEAGHMSVYEEEAVAYEKTCASRKQEFYRRMRIAAGNYQFIPELKELLNPFKGMIFVEFVSHKLLRTLAPFFLLLMFLASYFAPGDFFKSIFIMQALFYIVAFIGALLESLNIHIKYLYVPYYFCLSNLAVMMGFFRFVTGKHSIRW
ncbi:MAG: glycosyltransferase family 2 protein [Candidatus Omnitrophota bacterium]